MPNRLADENSPYLLQHKDNPVDWYSWGPEALEKARLEDKPIFLSIGYAACHWCHVMEHESFEDPDTAAIMNQRFVNIKVDREERPELDNIYMSAVVAMTGQGGWPMSVFLTPEGKPFYGGTYFPPVRRYNMPAFREVLLSIAEAWEKERGQIAQISEQLAARLGEEISQTTGGSNLTTSILEQAALGLAQAYDWQHGGWGKAPKFPQPMTIHFLLQRAARGDHFAKEIAVHALRAMAKGGMYDVVGGGFARYSVDNQWLIPHFEKMLYDNAQLARVYLYGYLLTGEQGFRRVCEGTIDFVSRELTDQGGGFYSSLDADSEGHEGKFYIWSREELGQVLNDPQEFALLESAYQLSESGNFEGKIVLQRSQDDDALAKQHDQSIAEIHQRLDHLHERLLAARSKRVRPGTDDKVLTAWNGLMLLTMAEAARYLNRQDYLQMAIRNADFLLQNLYSSGRLLRSWRAGDARHNGYLEDYGALALGLLALYQADPDPRWFTATQTLAEEMSSNFADPQGGFFDTRHDHEQLLYRPKDLQDNATPSGNALATTALLLLAALSGEGRWRDQAEAALRTVAGNLSRYPTAFGQWLCGLDLALHPIQEVAILGDPTDQRTQDLQAVVRESYRPHLVLASSPHPPPADAPALLAGRGLIAGQPSAYVCQQFFCQQPVSDPESLRAQLEAH